MCSQNYFVLQQSQGFILRPNTFLMEDLRQQGRLLIITDPTLLLKGVLRPKRLHESLGASSAPFNICIYILEVFIIGSMRREP